MKISEEELSRRKRRIIHTAFELFCRNGVDRVTIKDIAKMASVGEKSVYRYFNTKKELLLETGFVLWEEIVNELMVTIGSDYENKSGLEQVHYLLDGFRTLYENNADYVLFSYDYKLSLVHHAFVMTEAEYDEILRPIHDMYLDAIQKGIEDGSIAQREGAEDLYFAIWGLMRGFVVKMVIYDRMYAGKNPWKDRFDIACRLILSGLQHG